MDCTPRWRAKAFKAGTSGAPPAESALAKSGNNESLMAQGAQKTFNQSIDQEIVETLEKMMSVPIDTDIS